MKKIIFNILKISFSFWLLFYLFKDINFNQLFIWLKEVNMILLLFAFSLFYIATFISWFKVSYILWNFKYAKFIAKLNFITIFLNNFIPWSITSDIYKWYRLKKYFSWWKITFWILTDRLSWMIILLLFFGTSSLLFFNFLINNFNINFIFIYIGIIILVSIFMILYIFRKKILKINIIKEIVKSYKDLNIKKIIYIFLFTFFIRILTPIMFFIELISINPDFIHIPIYYILFITTFIELINIVPLTIKWYWIREFIWLTLLVPFWVTIETIAILSILIIINDLIASLLGFYFFNKKEKIS